MAAWRDEWLQIAALDPKQPIDHYLLDEWAKNSDLPNLSVYNIIQSSDHPQIIPIVECLNLFKEFFSIHFISQFNGFLLFTMRMWNRFMEMLRIVLSVPYF
jgi:hypothetical protein